MYRRILLTYYGPRYSAVALEQATALAKAFDAELHLLGIVATSNGIELAEASGTLDTLEVQKKRTETAVRNQAQRLRDQGLRVTESVCEGDPAIEIVTVAHRTHADLVVMGNTDKPALARWLQGETGSKLLSHMPCSVLLP